MEPSTQKSSPAIPIAIIAGFGMIALAIFFTGGSNSASGLLTNNNEASEEITEETEPRPVDGDDYIRGNPNAPIMMVEYSDYDCPFCAQYHRTMNQIMNEYGVTGRVAWVYRQYPLGQLHPNSPRISEAALCVGDIGGNEAFWQFTDLIFQEREIDEPTNVTRLPRFAEAVGVEEAAYRACMNEGRMRDRLKSDMASGFNSGARGTPFTMLMVGNEQVAVSGAQSYETVKAIIDNLLDQLDGNFDPASVEEQQSLPVNEAGLPTLE
jgi:protein-disulfide isomerase